MNVAQLSRDYKISATTLKRRLAAGWSMTRVLNTPVRRYSRVITHDVACDLNWTPNLNSRRGFYG